MYKEHKVVLPNAEATPGKGNTRQILLDIAHEGHPGIDAMKRFVREHMWYPSVDAEIEQIVESCLPCQASTSTKHRDPLVPTDPPGEVWTDLAADHWGPTPRNTHILVVIDKLSRYPEVVEVKGTGAEPNIEAFDTIFSRHGYCKTLVTDGGPPFNGNDSHDLQQYFRWAGIKHHPTTSAEDPEANGLAEAFMKHVKKIWHTCSITKKDPIAETNKHLNTYRATPHPSTGKTPAELMYGGRTFRTRLPEKQRKAPSQTVKEARNNDKQAKAKQKMYKDSKQYVRPHKLETGDQALLSQKQSKTNPPYDPRPYTIIEVKGHQITGQRNEKRVTRDAQKWKKLCTTRPRPLKQEASEESSDSDIDIDLESHLHQPGQGITEGARPEVGEQREEDPRPTAAAVEAPTSGATNQSATHHGDIVLPPRRNPPRARERPSRYR